MKSWLGHKRLLLHAWKRGARMNIEEAQLEFPLEYGLMRGAVWHAADDAEFAPFGVISLGEECRFEVGRDVRFGVRWDVRMQVPEGRPCIRIADECRIGDLVVLNTFAGAEIDIDSHCFIGRGTVIAAHQRVSIGEGTAIAEYVSIRDHNHAPDEGPVHLSSMTVSPVTIGRGVWIGAKVTITEGITIGDGAVIGANSVVTHNVPAGVCVGGVPARPLPRKSV